MNHIKLLPSHVYESFVYLPSPLVQVFKVFKSTNTMSALIPQNIPLTADLPFGLDVTSDVMLKHVQEVLTAFAVSVKDKALSLEDILVSFFTNKGVKDLMVAVSTLAVFSHEIHTQFKEHLHLLTATKQLKYFYNLPLGRLFCCLEDFWEGTAEAEWLLNLKTRVCTTAALAGTKPHQFFKEKKIDDYKDFAEHVEKVDPHAIYPTNIYRQCDGCTVSTEDCGTIESVMSTTLTTTIKTRKKVLDLADDTLSSIYRPLGRVVAIIDDKVEGFYGEDLIKYFAHHNIKYQKVVARGNEVDKSLEKVCEMLHELKKNGVSRNEPVLIIGGGVIADIAGFACGLYHRSTPYVMLCTSIVSGIDAGPSPRTCCDGFGYKNLYGAYHAPVLTITDRYFFTSLHEGWLRHGLAEIIKMATTKDYELFCLMQKAGPKLIRTKFGTVNLTDSPEDEEFDKLCDLVIGRALDSYVKSEYGNLWETHQCRPHAYGHTWSPGYELASGMLHGHAVATGMGFGAYLSFVEGWISEDEMKQVLTLISDMELSLWHDIMDEVDVVWSSQCKMVEKRGGHLCAPLPKGGLGKCGYLNDMPYDRLKQRLSEYKAICQSYPRQGYGLDVHCRDVGLEDPSVTAMHHMQNDLAAQAAEETKPTSYNEWIQQVQSTRNSDWKMNVAFSKAEDTKTPPAFEHNHLFHNGVEEYAMSMTSVPSQNVQTVAQATMENKMFAPCMVGTLEAQMLRMQVAVSRATRCLDVGTFTGMSAIAMAEGVPANGKVVTLEFDEKIADVAQKCFNESSVGDKIELIKGCAVESMQNLLSQGQKFDIIFLDADKDNYSKYYDLALSGLLSDDGFILADNSLCALLYDADDNRRQALHDFNQKVKNDSRVEQVMLSVREGITMIRPVPVRAAGTR